MTTMTQRQKDITTVMAGEESHGHWRNWRWQLKHAVRNLDLAQELLGIDTTLGS